jgi:serine/threonine protein kinase
VIAKVRNEKAKRFLTNMRDKQSIPFSRQFQGADPKALNLLKRMLAFDPQERPSAVEALRDEYFAGLANEAREPSATPISSYAFQFESRKLDLHDVRRLIYEEILEFHPLEKDRYREMRLLEQQRSLEYHRAQSGMPVQGFDYVDRNIPQGRSSYPVTYRQGGSQGQVHSTGSGVHGYSHTAVSAAVDSMRNMQVSQTTNAPQPRMGH